MKTIRSIDPSRTYLLRKQFVVSMNRRFNIVKSAIREFFSEDVQDFTLATDAMKIEIFRKWLKGQIDENILTTTNGLNNKSWTIVYIVNAYSKGLVRSYSDVNKAGKVLSGVNWFGGAQNQFLKDAMRMIPIISQIELLTTRTTNLLCGVTDDMFNKMSFALASGFAKKHDLTQIRKDLEKVINKVSKRRAKSLAVSDIVHAQAEGQLDGFELLGVNDIDAVVELLTENDLTCPVCKSLSKGGFTVDKARGLIPFHPLCRCAWSMGVRVEEKA